MSVITSLQGQVDRLRKDVCDLSARVRVLEEQVYEERTRKIEGIRKELREEREAREKGR